jgi:hypothetical protein
MERFAINWTLSTKKISFGYVLRSFPNCGQYLYDVPLT